MVLPTLHVPLDPVEAVVGDIDLHVDAVLDGNLVGGLVDTGGDLLGGIHETADNLLHGSPGDTDLLIDAGLGIGDHGVVLPTLHVPLDPVEAVVGDIDLHVDAVLDGSVIGDLAGNGGNIVGNVVGGLAGTGGDILGDVHETVGNLLHGAPGDTDLLIDAGLGIGDHGVVLPTLHVPLDPVEAVVGDIDLHVDAVLDGSVIGDLVSHGGGIVGGVGETVAQLVDGNGNGDIVGGTAETITQLVDGNGNGDIVGGTAETITQLVDGNGNGDIVGGTAETVTQLLDGNGNGDIVGGTAETVTELLDGNGNGDIVGGTAETVTQLLDGNGNGDIVGGTAETVTQLLDGNGNGDIVGGTAETVTQLLDGNGNGDIVGGTAETVTQLLDGSGGGAGDTDLVVDAGLGALHTPTLEVGLDPVESIIGDIDVHIDAAANLLHGSDPSNLGPLGLDLGLTVDAPELPVVDDAHAFASLGDLFSNDIGIDVGGSVGAATSNLDNLPHPPADLAGGLQLVMDHAPIGNHHGFGLF